MHKTYEQPENVLSSYKHRKQFVESSLYTYNKESVLNTEYLAVKKSIQCFNFMTWSNLTVACLDKNGYSVWAKILAKTVIYLKHPL